tara:strand:- start:899 stop:1276 length:378 start_codon:yes stop_codon:yes gene_type:complete
MKKIIFIILFFHSLNMIGHAVAKNINEVEIYKNLRCLVCQGQSIADSNSEFSLTIKEVVQDLIRTGKSEREIYQFLTEKYGDWILYKPQYNMLNSFLWISPYLVLFLGGILIFLVLRKRKNLKNN